MAILEQSARVHSIGKARIELKWFYHTCRADGTIGLFHFEDDSPIMQLGTPRPNQGQDVVCAKVFDSKAVMVSGNRNGVLERFDLSLFQGLGQPVTSIGIHAAPIHDLDIIRERYVITAGGDGSLGFADGTMDRFCRAHRSPSEQFFSVQTRPNHEFQFATGGTKSALLWDLRQTASPMEVLASGSDFSNVTWNFEGTKIICTTIDDRVLVRSCRLNACPTTVVLKDPRFHNDNIHTKSIILPNDHVASGSRNGCILIWRLPHDDQHDNPQEYPFLAKTILHNELSTQVKGLMYHNDKLYACARESQLQTFSLPIQTLFEIN